MQGTALPTGGEEISIRWRSCGLYAAWEKETGFVVGIAVIPITLLSPDTLYGHILWNSSVNWKSKSRKCGAGMGSNTMLMKLHRSSDRWKRP